MAVAAGPAFIAAGLCLSAPTALAQEGDSDLANQLANPLAALISIPIQGNADWNIGPLEDGSKVFANVQPVIPFTLNEDWNLISRTILPIAYQREVFPGAGTQFGLGDITQSLFFSPSRIVDGVTWGVGPVFLIPTATDSLLGTNRWGAGPTAVILRQAHGWTYGILANHIWTSGSSSEPNTVNQTYLQPFLSYSTKDAWTFTLNTESSYDWTSEEWSVPINFQVAKIVRFGKLPVQLFGGVRYWAESPISGPHDFGARFGMTFLLPKKPPAP